MIAAVAYVPLILIDAGTNLFFALLLFFRFSIQPSPTQQQEKHPPFLVEIPLATAISGFSPAHTMAVGYLLITAAVGICLLAFSPFFFILPVLIFTCGEALFAPSSATVVANLAPSAQRSAYIGLSWMAGSLGFIAGPMLGGALLHLSALLYWAVLLLVGLLSIIFAWSIPTAVGK